MLRTALESFRSSASTGLEITSAGVCGVAIAPGRTARVSGVAWEPLPTGALRPTAADTNVVDRGALAGALESVLGQLGKPRRVALALPDAVGKVSILTLEDLPKHRVEVEQVIRWQIRKAIPFPVDLAQVSWTEAGSAGDGGRRLVVAVARRDIVEEYESVCGDAGAHAGFVSLATFNVVNTVLAGRARSSVDQRAASTGWLLVHVTPESTSLVIVREGRPVFFRGRQGAGESDVIDAIHQSAMYFEDRLGGQRFERVWVHASGNLAGADALWTTVESRLGLTLEKVDPRLAADFGGFDVDHWQVAAATASLGALLQG